MPSKPADFRRLALKLPQTEERSHMNHLDFRFAGKIFATLAYPKKDQAMVKLTPIQQEDMVKAQSAAVQPVSGAWGRKGCTNVFLPRAGKKLVREALLMAWRNCAPSELVMKSLVRKSRTKRKSA